MKALRLLCSCLAVLAFTTAALGQLNPNDVPPTPTGYPTYTATSTGGPWNSGPTWIGGAIPGPNAVVTIPLNVIVTIDHLQNDPANSPKWIRVEGTLAVSTAVNTRFYVETIYVTPSGTFSIGSAAAPLPMGRTAEIIFTSDGPINNTTWDLEQISRGLVAEGRVQVYGVSRTYAAAVTTDVPKTTTRTMTLLTAPANWQAGDEVVLTGTYFRRRRPSQDELRRVETVSGTTLTVDTAFSNDHLHVSSGALRPNFHVANLTRNVIFRSHKTANWYDRGHIILMNTNCQIQWAALIDLGRTRKAVPLNDFKVTPTGTAKETTPSLVTNRRGRYALHVHKAGWGNPPYTALPLTNITGCVSIRTPGWAFVNHGSNVDFRRNIAYNFVGAGFVSEDGDEIGYFVNNIAIRGTGTGEYLKSRINFQHPTRKQALADFAFTGDGFWFNGPAIKVNGAIANGCNGRGMVWHTTGAVDPKSANATYPYGRYSFFPRNQLAAVYGTTFNQAYGENIANLVPRTWAGNTNAAVISDLPAMQSVNIESYGNLIGLHLRFNNFDNLAWYTEDPFNYDDQIVAVPGFPKNQLPSRMTETLGNVTLWNDEVAIAIRYAGKAIFNTVTAINRLDYDEPVPSNDPSSNPIYGTEAFFNLSNMTFNGVTIDGWDIANYLTSKTNAFPNGLTGTNISFPGAVYLNYAHNNVWDLRTAATPCSLPGLNTIMPPPGSTSVTLSWTGAAGPSGKFLIRYRILGTLYWTYRETTLNSISVATAGGQPYRWQVMHGCGSTNTLSNWTAQGSFNT